MGYHELQIIVEDEKHVRIRSQDGAEQGGEFRLTQLHRDLIAIFDHFLQEKTIQRRSELEGFGALLYESLLSDSTGHFLKQRLDHISEPNRLRLQLVFRSESLELAGIPWEFLYYPDHEAQKGFFLATHHKLVLSRYMPRNIDRPVLSTDEKTLRFLVVISQPKSLNPVLANVVAETIQGLKLSVPTEVEPLYNPTIESFIDKVENFRPHVLHFMGHGQYDQNEDSGQIALTDDDQETPVWVTDRTFAEYFERYQPRLVLLHACEGAKIDFARNYAGLAPQLIRMGIPAVVAMQYPVTNRTAIDFSMAFYASLAKQEPIDGAVQEGRRHIALKEANAYSNRNFGIPVLYMNSLDGLILPDIKNKE